MIRKIKYGGNISVTIMVKIVPKTFSIFSLSTALELTFGFMRGSTRILEGGSSELEYGWRTRVIVWWQEGKGRGGWWERVRKMWFNGQLTWFLPWPERMNWCTPHFLIFRSSSRHPSNQACLQVGVDLPIMSWVMTWIVVQINTLSEANIRKMKVGQTKCIGNKIKLLSTRGR